ncbi:outer membrane protein [Kaistia nematophila]|uniref:Porin family protein n=1 Tax=Kaistia nematophila TaxID=2994654 RepID=A0A9X3E7I1_9HYPH|nr:outer membrane protein [Kaistia nematophila]MCX5572197.1 porin family protein [Kaistia nematophila]
MKNTALGLLIAVGLTGAVQAADLSTPDEPVPPPAPAFSWTGVYIGAHGGYAWSDFTSEPTDAYGGVKPDGWFGGAQGGFNYQFSNNIVLGIEADASFGDQKDGISTLLGDPTENAFALDYSTKIESFGTVRARAGYAFDRFLPYVTGGLAWANAELDFHQQITADGNVVVDNSASDKQTFTGWALGAGLEYAVTNHVTAKVEYLYADLGSKDFDLGTPVRADLTTQTIKFGLNYKF